MSAAARAGAYLDWGDALRLAAEASAEAPERRRGGPIGEVVGGGRLAPPGESWARAGEVLRGGGELDPEGAGDAAARGAAACAEALGRGWA